MHMHMSINPVFLLHCETCFCITVHTERKRSNEKITCIRFISDSVIEGECCPGPVYHAFITGFMLEVHRKAMLIDVIAVLLTELRVHVRRPFCC